MESRGDGTYRTKHKAIIKNTASVKNIAQQNNQPVIYPNPATNFLNITFKEANTFKITDMIGREMMVGNIENNNIDISKLATGNYIIHVYKNHEIKGIQKFIKQ